MKTIHSILLAFSLVLSGSICQGIEAFLYHREMIDLARVAGTSTVLLVGDDHTQPAIKKFLENGLHALQRLGFSCLAFEMLPVNFQGDLDVWSSESRERIRQHLVTAWGEKGPRIPDALFSLLKRAKEQGMKVIALDPIEADRLSRVTVNPYWADCIKNCLGQNHKCRMIVIAGRSHVDPIPGSLYSLLKNEGIPTSVVEFAGLEKQETAQMDLKTARLLGRPAHPATLLTLEGYQSGRRENFMIMSDNQSLKKKKANWIVHLVDVPPALATLLALR